MQRKGEVLQARAPLEVPSDSWFEKELKDITPDDVYRLIFEQIDSSLSLASKKKVLVLVRRIFQMALDEGIISRNPAAQVKVREEHRLQKVLTSAEAQKLLHEAYLTNHRFYPIWVMALKTGMRSGEMFALTWNDVDLEAATIQVSKQWTNCDGIDTPKNGEWRTVPISPDLKAFLTRYRLENPGHEASLFDLREQVRVTRSDYVLPRLKEWENGEQAQVTMEFCRSIGVTPIRFHDLRATFITNLLACGVPLVKVMSIVGHRKMSTTDVCLRLAGVDVRGATNTMGYELPTALDQAVVLNFDRKR